MENLKEIIELHQLWLTGDNGGKRANLSGADLSGADLSRANLSRADLFGVDLSGADLSGADLSEANLSRAVLSGADLSGADLPEANLSGANLYGANLSGADLSGADLSGAIKVPMYCKWSFGITDQLIHIGCEKRTVEEWKDFLVSEEVISTPRDTEKFKQIVKVIKALIAYIEG